MTNKAAPGPSDKNRTGGFSRRSLLNASAVGAATLSAGCLGEGSGGGEKITVGGLAPLSGAFTVSGESHEIAMNMAVEHAREEGDTSREIELLMADTESSPQPAQQAAQQHLDDGADFIIGNQSSAVAVALTEFAKRRETLYMGGAGSLAPTSEGCGKTAFILSDGAVQQTNSALGHALREGLGSSVFEISMDYSWGQSIHKYNKGKLTPNNNAESLGNIYTPIGTSDFSQALTEAKNADPDILNLNLYGGDQIRAVKQAEEFGLMDGETVITIPSTTVAFAQQIGLDTFAYDRLFGGVYYSPKVDTPASNEFDQAYREASGGDPPISYSPVYYISLRMVLRSIERTGSKDSETIADDLEDRKLFPQIWNRGERIRACDHRATAPTLTIQGIPEADANVEEGNVFDIVAVPEELEKYMRACEETGCEF